MPNSENTPDPPTDTEWLFLTAILLFFTTLTFSFLPCAAIFRPLRLELCARSEVAPLDGAPVQAATGQRHVSGADGPGPVLHDGGGLQATLLTVWGRPLCSPGHLEIW